MRLYNPLAGKLSAFCLAKSHNRDEAREIVSETILAAYENFYKIRNEQAFLSFLFTIASNILKAKTKRNSRFVLYDNDVLDTMYGEYLEPETAMDIKILYETLNLLHDNQKEAIYLFDIMGMTQKEIADIQNTTVINVKLRIHRGKKKLTELLTGKVQSDKSKKKCTGTILAEKGLNGTDEGVCSTENFATNKDVCSTTQTYFVKKISEAVL